MKSHRHQSLDSEFMSPPPLVPMRKMGSNKPCWCRSGKKWKHCHKDREQQTPDHIGATMADMRKELRKAGYCLHPEANSDNCGSRIIRAHTVQRKGGLAEITESGHVISVKAGFEDIHKNDGNIVPRKVSARDASTFMGFCDRHDTEMFKPVETDTPVLSKENVFLLSFRAVSYELYTKNSTFQYMSKQRESDKGQPFELQCFIQQQLYDYECGMKRGLESLEKWKAYYDLAYKNNNYESFNIYAIAFSTILPVVGCGAFMPEFDFNGIELQKISHGNAQFEHISYNLTVLNGVSVAVFGWTHDYSGPAAQFIETLEEMPAKAKADAVVQLAFEHLENVYMKPSWWHNLPEDARDQAVHRSRSGTGLGGNERLNDCLSDLYAKHIFADVIQEVKNLV